MLHDGMCCEVGLEDCAIYWSKMKSKEHRLEAALLWNQFSLSVVQYY